MTWNEDSCGLGGVRECWAKALLDLNTLPIPCLVELTRPACSHLTLCCMPRDGGGKSCPGVEGRGESCPGVERRGESCPGVEGEG